MAEPKKTAQGTWRIQLEANGQRDSGTFPTAREAREWRDRRTVELRAIAGGRAGEVHTLGQALEKYAREVSPNRRGERWEIVRLSAFQNEKLHGLPIKKPVALVTDDDVRAWRDRRLETKGRGTVLREMTLLSSVLEQARTEWKWISSNPVRDVKKPRKPAHRKRVISGLEIRGVLRALGYSSKSVRTVSQCVAVAFLLALATGMRAKEICTLRWEDVRAMYGTAQNVKSLERGVIRDVPFSRVARRLLERMRGWDDELVFGLTTQTLDALFRKARKKAGLEGFTFHDSRHTAATRIALSGRVNVLELCKIFGWKSATQALTYFNPTADDLAAKLG